MLVSTSIVSRFFLKKKKKMGIIYLFLRLRYQHWHGFFQNTTAWADGPVGITQCPITPTDSFEYIFSAASQTGTYWYHSHYCKLDITSHYFSAYEKIP